MLPYADGTEAIPSRDYDSIGMVRKDGMEPIRGSDNKVDWSAEPDRKK
jgi:hypothetical protein